MFKICNLYMSSRKIFSKKYHNEFYKIRRLKRKSSETKPTLCTFAAYPTVMTKSSNPQTSKNKKQVHLYVSKTQIKIGQTKNTTREITIDIICLSKYGVSPTNERMVIKLAATIGSKHARRDQSIVRYIVLKISHMF